MQSSRDPRLEDRRPGCRQRRGDGRYGEGREGARARRRRGFFDLCVDRKGVTRVIESFIGIGSNVGGRAEFVRSAVENLNSAEGVEVTATSSLYETSPIGGPPQRSYINMVVRLRTSLDHRELLELCQ